MADFDFITLLNLLALGRDASSYPSSPRMFNRRNDGALCTLLYTLLSEMGVGSELEKAWPLLDNATKRRFRRLAVDILQGLVARGVLPRGRHLATSATLSAAKGPRVVELVWRLSSIVLAARLERQFPQERAVSVLSSALRSGWAEKAEEAASSSSGSPACSAVDRRMQRQLAAVRARTARANAVAAIEAAALVEVRRAAEAERQAIERASLAIEERGRALLARSRALDAARGASQLGRADDAASRGRDRIALRALAAQWAEIVQISQSDAVVAGTAALEQLGRSPAAAAAADADAAWDRVDAGDGDAAALARSWTSQLNALAETLREHRRRSEVVLPSASSLSLLQPKGARELRERLAARAEAEEERLAHVQRTRRDYDALRAELRATAAYSQTLGGSSKVINK